MSDWFTKYNCKESGCFKDKYMAKWDKYNDCFPGKICISDVDGIVERHGRLLIIEHKKTGTPLKVAQRIMAEKTTKINKHLIFVTMFGDPETMEATGFDIFMHGVCDKRPNKTTKDFRKFLKDWYRAANARLI